MRTCVNIRLKVIKNNRRLWDSSKKKYSDKSQNYFENSLVNSQMFKKYLDTKKINRTKKQSIACCENIISSIIVIYRTFSLDCKNMLIEYKIPFNEYH